MDRSFLSGAFMVQSTVDQTHFIHLHELDSVKFPLAEAFYRSHKYKIGLGRQERIFIATQTAMPINLHAQAQTAGQSPVAAARLLAAGDQAYWLRNLLVEKNLRGNGLGRQLMTYLLTQINPQACYCFALPDVTGFYLQLGFVQPPLQACPEFVQQQYRKYKSRGRDWVLMVFKPSITKQ